MHRATVTLGRPLAAPLFALLVLLVAFGASPAAEAESPKPQAEETPTAAPTEPTHLPAHGLLPVLARLCPDAKGRRPGSPESGGESNPWRLVPTPRRARRQRLPDAQRGLSARRDQPSHRGLLRGPGHAGLHGLVLPGRAGLLVRGGRHGWHPDLLHPRRRASKIAAQRSDFASDSRASRARLGPVRPLSNIAVVARSTSREPSGRNRRRAASSPKSSGEMAERSESTSSFEGSMRSLTDAWKPAMQRPT